MTPLFGYFACLAMLTPALSLDVFFGLLGKTSRQHDILALIRTIVQLLSTVTSPFRIALTVAVLVCAHTVESDRPKRVIAWVVLCAGSLLHLMTISRDAGANAALILVPSTLVTLASFSWSSRVLDAEDLS